MYEANSIDDVCTFVRESDHVRVQGGGSKPQLSGGAELSLRALSGVVEYQPDEYTFTAWAGTPIRQLQEVLAEHSQYLPFEPPLADAGATLGGTVAAGLSGSGQWRFGGVRDFIIGTRLVNGNGDVVRGGGKVVKNAAGFDLPKLVVGSLGRYGVLVELTFKVFPAPQTSATLAVEVDGLEESVALMKQLATQPLDLHCLDLEPPGKLWIRVSGLPDSLPQRLERIESSLASSQRVQVIDDDDSIWHAAAEFQWIGQGRGIIKLPLVPDQIDALERELGALTDDIPRRYSVGGNVAWIGWPHALEIAGLEEALLRLNRPALRISGAGDGSCLIGPQLGRAFYERIESVFDPAGKFAWEQVA